MISVMCGVLRQTMAARKDGSLCTLRAGPPIPESLGSQADSPERRATHEGGSPRAARRQRGCNSRSPYHYGARQGTCLIAAKEARQPRRIAGV
jgi:hypothetical protein